MKVGVISLGCAKNLVDTEVMLGILQDNGIEITPNPADADILIINTCAFIASAKEESITTILNFAAYKDEFKCKSLIVAGCLGQRYRQELLDEMPEIDAIVGTSAWHRIMEAVEETLSGRRVILIGENEIIYSAKTPRLRTTPDYTAYVKIAEGCNHRCAFCAIPLIRGKQISRSIDDIKAEVERLARDGVKEINLIAQDTTNYGRDIYGEPKLCELLRELVKVEKIRWIRIMYAYPKNFTDELIDLIAAEPKICNYVDLPLQHADAAVLKRMHRPDTRASIEILLN
ncbi:MAG: MiaB/RimO family radical SAM methylthiotransferase, partial [Selenomonadaceae bacterium]|nr:MiaB/RimO family radical SAM methylthiotransferase [Selenomonadaceae bacterium]